MKIVLIAVAALLAIGARAQESCPSPSYTQDITPVCPTNKRIKLPNYSDPTTYWSCTTGKPVLTSCTAPTLYFSYVLQECSTCANYIPPVECSQNKLGLECKDIVATTGGSTSGTTATTADGATTKSTAAPTTASTASGATVTTALPGPPVDSTTASGGTATTNGNDPSGTTIYVPQPPSPNDPDVPAPPTPAPTVGTIATGPPVAPS